MRRAALATAVVLALLVAVSWGVRARRDEEPRRPHATSPASGPSPRLAAPIPRERVKDPLSGALAPLERSDPVTGPAAAPSAQPLEPRADAPVHLAPAEPGVQPSREPLVPRVVVLPLAPAPGAEPKSEPLVPKELHLDLAPAAAP